MDFAHDAEDRSFPDMGDPFGGGYRHCVAACCVKSRHGVVGDLLIAAWDWWNEDPTSANSQGDMAGERAGKCVAKSGQSCEAGCKNAYTNPASPCKPIPNPPKPKLPPPPDDPCPMIFPP